MRKKYQYKQKVGEFENEERAVQKVIGTAPSFTLK
jgi:hypothetical protein